MFVISTDFLEITQCSPTDFPMGGSLDNSSCQIVGEQEKYSINLHILNLRFFYYRISFVLTFHYFLLCLKYKTSRGQFQKLSWLVHCPLLNQLNCVLCLSNDICWVFIVHGFLAFFNFFLFFFFGLWKRVGLKERPCVYSKSGL